MPNNCNVCEPSCTCGCQTGTPKFVNLTESIVRIFDPKIMKLIDSEYSYLDVGYDVKLFTAMATLIAEPSGVALSDKNVKMHTTQKPCYTLYGEVYSGTVAVPAPAEGTLYIVSEKILRANPYRDDLVVPYKPVKCYGVAANGPEDVVIGYCGFYKPYLPEDEEESSPIYVISKPTKISGFTGDKVSMGVSFESADPAVKDITVTYTPINCAVVDTFAEPEETVPSGTTKMIAGQLLDVNYHLAKLQVVVGAAEGFITITYGDNVETTIKVAVKESTATSVAWDDITDRPEAFTPAAHTHVVADVTDFDPSEYAPKEELTSTVGTLATKTDLDNAVAGLATTDSVTSSISEATRDLATKEELASEVAKLATKEELTTAQGLLATKTELAEAVKDVVKLQDSADAEQQSKTIQLANNDSISGVMTTGDSANLVMVGKSDNAEFGSTKLRTNVNTSKDGQDRSIVTVNTKDVVITDKLLGSVITTGDSYVKVAEGAGENETKKIVLTVDLESILSRITALEEKTANL